MSRTWQQRREDDLQGARLRAQERAQLQYYTKEALLRLFRLDYSLDGSLPPVVYQALEIIANNISSRDIDTQLQIAVLFWVTTLRYMTAEDNLITEIDGIISLQSSGRTLSNQHMYRLIVDLVCYSALRSLPPSSGLETFYDTVRARFLEDTQPSQPTGPMPPMPGGIGHAQGAGAGDGDALEEDPEDPQTRVLNWNRNRNRNKR